jgi:hypothetical protein
MGKRKGEGKGRMKITGGEEEEKRNKKKLKKRR